MEDVSELDDLLAEVDDDTADLIKARFKAQEDLMAQREAKVTRDAKIAKDSAKFIAKFPRAMKAYEKGRFTLPDDPSDDALLAALKDKEAELEELGVPVGPTPLTDAARGRDDGEEDPAAVWGQDIGTGRNESSARGLIEDLRDTFTGGEYGSSVDAIGKIAELHKRGQLDDYHAFIEELHPKYPVGQGPGSRLTNFEQIIGAGHTGARRGRPKGSKNAPKE